MALKILIDILSFIQNLGLLFFCLVLVLSWIFILKNKHYISVANTQSMIEFIFALFVFAPYGIMIDPLKMIAAIPLALFASATTSHLIAKNHSFSFNKKIQKITNLKQKNKR